MSNGWIGRSLGLLLALLLMFVMAACGSGDQSEPAAGTPAGSAETPSGTSEGGAAEPAAAAEVNAAEIEAAAKKEGKLVWYAGASADDMQKFADKFMEKYPEIKVEMISLNADQVPARVAVEHRGKLYNVDILSASGWPMDQVERQGALQQFKLPQELIDGMVDGAVDPEGYWVSQYVLTLPISYNTKALEANGLQPPTSLWDLTKPEWKGKFGMTPDDFEWYAGLEKAYGEQQALELLKGLAANEPIFRDSSTLQIELLKTGEFVASIHAYGYRVDREKAKGTPLDYVNYEPTITLLQPQGIAKNAPHPNAAKLFQMWIVAEETQKFILETTNRTSAHKNVLTESEVWNPAKYKYLLSDPNSGEKYTDYQKLYEETLGLK